MAGTTYELVEMNSPILIGENSMTQKIFEIGYEIDIIVSHSYCHRNEIKDRATGYRVSWCCGAGSTKYADEMYIALSTGFQYIAGMKFSTTQMCHLVTAIGMSTVIN